MVRKVQDRPWHPEKARSNLARHGISFDEARSVLLDPLTRFRPDVQHSVNEDRVTAIGIRRTGGALFIVIALDRQGRIRIISARRATKRERHAYEAR